MTRYFIGIDNGSQSSKVTIFDEFGNAVASGRRALRPNHTPRPGVVEHPNDDLWTTIAAASRDAMAAFAGDPGDIVGVGLCTIRFCRAMLRADGSLAQPVLSWMDARVSRPYEHSNPEVAWVTTSSGYITQRITGNFVDTAANYQGMWPMNVDTGRWFTEGPEFERAGIPRDMLFNLVQPGDVLGRVTEAAANATGIPAGLPVVATANDKAVEALGSGLRSDDTLLVSLGTYIASMTVGPKNVPDATSFWTNFASTPHEYLYESEGIRRGMWTISWFRDVLGPEAAGAAASEGLSVEEALNKGAEQVPAGSDGLMTVLDWLAPTEAPFRKGAILGFDGRQGRFHIFRSILEGIAMSMLVRGQRMEKELGAEYTHVVVSGGGSRSGLMMQIMADVFGLPAVRNTVTDAAGLGAAVCVAAGLGIYDSFDTAAQHMVQEQDRFEPDPERHALYVRLTAVYADITAHTDEIFRRSAHIVG